MRALNSKINAENSYLPGVHVLYCYNPQISYAPSYVRRFWNFPCPPFALCVVLASESKVVIVHSP